MDKRRDRMFTRFLIFMMMSCALTVMVCYCVIYTVTAKNISSCISKLNINNIYTHDNSKALLDIKNKTSLSSAEVNQVMSSNQYADIVGDYMLEEDMLGLGDILDNNSYNKLETIKELEGLSEEATLSSDEYTHRELSNMFKELGIDYQERDIIAFQNSIKNDVSKEVSKQMDKTMQGGVSPMFNTKTLINYVNDIFSKNTIYICWGGIIVSGIFIAMLNFKFFRFLSIYAVLSGILSVITRITYIAINKLLEFLPKAYQPMVRAFTNSLDEMLMKQFYTLLVITLVCIIAYILLNFTINERSIVDILDIFNLRKKFGKNKSELAIDVPSIQIDNIDTETVIKNIGQGRLADEVDLSEMGSEFEEGEYEEKQNKIKNNTFEDELTFPETEVARKPGIIYDTDIATEARKMFDDL